MKVYILLNLTPANKITTIKHHWFRQHVESGELKIAKVDYYLQKEDIFTTLIYNYS